MKTTIIFILVFILVLIAFVWWIYMPMHRHNRMAAEYLSELSEVALHPDDHLCNTYSKVGLLVGNGNHCDILCISFWQSDIPVDELKTKIAKSSDKVVFVDDEDKMNYFYESFYGIEPIVKAKLQEKNCTYLIYRFCSFMPEGDIRCY